MPLALLQSGPSTAQQALMTVALDLPDAQETSRALVQRATEQVQRLDAITAVLEERVATKMRREHQVANAPARGPARTPLHTVADDGPTEEEPTADAPPAVFSVSPPPETP